MSKLDELIQQYCPDGVEFVPLWSVTIWDKKFNSVDKKKQPKVISYPYLLAKDMFALEQEDGDVFLLSTGEQTGWTTEDIAGDFWCKGEVVSIPWGKSRKVSEVMKYYKGKFVTADNRIATSSDTSTLSNKYLYYWMMSQGDLIDSFYRGSGLKHPSMKDVLDMKIPLPPLEVQSEIVRILDNFTLLTAELTAELTARKSQYEFYRNELLKVDGSIKTVALEEIADIGTGSSNTNEGLEEGLYPFYVRSQEPLRKNEYEYDETAIITAGDGVGVGKVYHYVEGKYALHQRAYRIHINTPEVLPKYYFHYMKSTFLPYIQKTMFQGSVASIRRPMLNKFPVPVPSLEVQKKIIDVLENFESICSDLNIGLPAEIEARQKQYEYYRDALLTYAATGKIIAKTDRQTDRQTAEHIALIKLCQYVFGVVFVNLSDIATITRGGNFQKKDFTDIGVPCIHYGQMYTHFGIYTTEALKCISEDVAKKSKMAVKNDIVMAVTSENVEDVCKCTAWLGIENIAVSGHTAIIHHNQNAKYLSYYFHSTMFSAQKKRLAHGTKVIEVTPNALNDVVIPLPSLDEQERIVSILDRFDTLCNDLSIGLPAEIEARQKQYEYYRDRLLNFEPITK